MEWPLSLDRVKRLNGRELIFLVQIKIFKKKALMFLS